MNALDVVTAFKQAGLPVEKVTDLNAKTDGNQLLGRPGQYTSKTDFYDGRHLQGDLDPVNTVEVFASAEDAKRRHDYVDGIVKAAPLFAQYLLLRGKVLARLDKAVLPEEAEAYRKALDSIVPAD